MKTFYCVTSTVYDSGRISAAVTGSTEAEVKPEVKCAERSDRDIYTDWFDSIGEAKAFVEEAKKA